MTALGKQAIVLYRFGQRICVQPGRTAHLQLGDEVWLLKPELVAVGPSEPFAGDRCAYAVAATCPLCLVPLHPADTPWACSWIDSIDGAQDELVVEVGVPRTVGRSPPPAAGSPPPAAGYIGGPMRDPRISRKLLTLEQQPGRPASCTCLHDNGILVWHESSGFEMLEKDASAPLLLGTVLQLVSPHVQATGSSARFEGNVCAYVVTSELPCRLSPRWPWQLPTPPTGLGGARRERTSPAEVTAVAAPLTEASRRSSRAAFGEIW